MFTGYNIKLFLSIFLLTTTFIVYTQQPGTKSLQDKITENYKLFMSKPDRAFLNTGILLEEAINIKDQNSELILLSHRCWYYNHTIDIDNLISSAKLLQKKAVEYKNQCFQAEAHNYFLSVYINNHLYEKAVAEFEKAMAILKKEDEEDYGIIMAKDRAYVYMARLYMQKEEPEKALPYLFATIKESEKLKDPEQRKDRQYKNYSNIARCYLKINSDSAEHYVQKSISFKPEKVSDDDYTLCINYILLGDVCRFRENYREALTYYHKAETIMQKNSSNILNSRELFKRLQAVYTTLSDTINAYSYTLKLKEFDLQVSQNKYNSLHKILEDTPKEDQTKTYVIGSVGLVLTLGLIFFTYRLKKKNKLLQEQEVKSQEYLKEQKIQLLNNNHEQVYKDLIEKVKNNDVSFLASFLERFPDFAEKLQNINHRIVQTEIEFCAFLKLNIPTKEIARYKNIEPRTVQTKKYLIRKKLNIPKGMDIYFWFSKL